MAGMLPGVFPLVPTSQNRKRSRKIRKDVNVRVLVACEFSGIVRDAFIARGHQAISCDLLPSERPGLHYQGDVFALWREEFDLVIAHPPCTYLANSGVRWLRTKPDRIQVMKEAAKFFRLLLHWPCKRIAVENPIPHKYALEIIGRKYDQIVQPWMFGHGETKATCLWLKGLPKLTPTNIVDGRHGRVWREAPSPDRWKNRSRTYSGIAVAMAEQWG